MKIAIYTLGCKVNQYETQAMETILRQRGHQLVDFEEQADAYIINTCTVTAVSDKKSRQAIRRCRRLNPEAVVAVCGCYAQTTPEAVEALEVDLIYGTGDRMQFLDDLESAVHGRQKVNVDEVMARRSFEFLPAGGLEGRTRCMLKVEDGCVNFCTYCTIPYARGPVRSLGLDQAVAEARRMEEQGYREIVLTGIEISSWGKDLRNGLSLIDLIEAVCQAVPALRIRLGSLEPRTITEDFCARAAKLPNLCPHFHLSLQSGCDATLKRMNRKYDTARYLESCALLRQHFDRPAITTDLITGFPGETEEEFSATLDFIQRANFAAMHIFPYSRRSGTPAYDMPDQVPMAEKEARAHRAAQVAAQMEADYLAHYVGKTLPVLFEEEKDGLWRGHAPNYVEIRCKGEALHNELRDVLIESADGSLLYGKLVEQA